MHDIEIVITPQRMICRATQSRLSARFGGNYCYTCPEQNSPTSLTSASAMQHSVCPLLPRADVPHSRAATILVGFVQAYRHLLTFDLYVSLRT